MVKSKLMVAVQEREKKTTFVRETCETGKLGTGAFK